MNARGPKPKPPPPAAAGSGVLVQKWQPTVPSGLRTKTCDRCGKNFELATDEKFFLCRDCYEQEARRQQGKRKRGTAILSLIHCAGCGAEEYLDFVPSDPAEALCRACFGRKRREQKSKATHSHA
jgi:predicted RNA-binding Zn-ribbon protein involved in translation (DUF1610 family)